jgi:hypothetical protein
MYLTLPQSSFWIVDRMLADISWPCPQTLTVLLDCSSLPQQQQGIVRIVDRRLLTACSIACHCVTTARSVHFIVPGITESTKIMGQHLAWGMLLLLQLQPPSRFAHCIASVPQYHGFSWYRCEVQVVHQHLERRILFALRWHLLHARSTCRCCLNHAPSKQAHPMRV